MSIEAQVNALLDGQTEQTTILKDIQTKVSTPPTATVDLSPVLTAIAAVQTDVTTIKTDITDPNDTIPAV